MSEYKLTTEILALSAAKTWDEAKLEWHLEEVYEDEPSTCLCGHFPIVEHCTIRNQTNGNSAIVGNCCANKFGLASDKIFRAIARVRKDQSRSLNAETIAHAHQKRWINDWERKFYFDTMRQRSMSNKQSKKRYEINVKIVKCFGQTAPANVPIDEHIPGSSMPIKEKAVRTPIYRA